MTPLGGRSTFQEVTGALLDRDVELSLLSRQVASIRTGQGRVVMLEGPAGIGKSSLLAAVGRSARAQGIMTLVARGGPLERNAVWGIARQLFEPIRTSDHAWGEIGTGAALLAARVLNKGSPEPAMPDDAVHAAVHGLVCLACKLAERAPLLLIVDDVHWADAASLRWLIALSRRFEDLPLGILCGLRSGELAAEPDMLAELIAAALDAPVRPRALGLAAVETLVAAHLPGADPHFAQSCHAVSGGNPFLLGALLRHLVAEGIVPNNDNASCLDSFGPEQIARGVQRQLSRLPEGADRLATALAVLGRSAPLRHAARLVRQTLPRAAVLADALRDAGLVTGSPEIALTHPLIAAALYAHLPAGVRADYHAKAAQVLAEEGVDVDQIALHLLHSDPQGDPAIVAALRAAAASAISRGAPESAAEFLRRALTEPPIGRSETSAIHLDLGLAQAVQWKHDAYELLSSAVALAPSPVQRASTALKGARALGQAGYFEEAFNLASQGLGDAAGISAQDRERLEAELICDATMQSHTHTEMTARLQAATQRPSKLGIMAINIAQQLAFAGQPQHTVQTLLASVSAAGVLDSETDSLLPTAAAIVMIANDQLDGALAWSSGLIEFARPRGWLVALAHASFLRSMALVRSGRINEAEPNALLALEFKAGKATPQALMWPLHTFVDVLTESDRLKEAEEALAAVGQLADPPIAALGSPLLLQSRARLRLAQHRPGDAYADAYAAGQRWEELSVCHPVMASWRVEAVQSLAALGRRSECARLAREQFQLAERLGTPAALATALRTLVGAGLVENPETSLREASMLAAQSPAQLEYARILVDLGSMLRRANQRAQAQTPLREALDLANRHGMLLIARRADAELRAAGARPRRPACTGPASLTPAEDCVADLARRGCSNQDIAGQLFITRRTVETHLTHVFAKLGITSRADLASVLAGSGPEQIS